MTSQAAKALTHGAEKMGKTLGEDVGNAVKELYRTTGNRLKRSAENHVDHDAEHASKIARILDGGKKDVSRRPGDPGGTHLDGGGGNGPKKYFIHDDGRVQELRDGGLHDVDPKDGSGVHTILDSDRKRVQDPSASDMKKKYHARQNKKKPDEGVDSKKITDPTDLSRATEEARKANADYGGKNYAALRYKDEHGNDFILVGRSGDKRSHSERSIGKPLLGGREGNVSQIYTERAPCQADANCNRWMGRHFEPHNPDLQVSHGVDYDNKVSQADRDFGHKAYLDQLKQDHGAGRDGGTMGTDNFDERGEALKAARDAKRKARTDKLVERGL